MVECLLFSFVDVGCFQGDRFVLADAWHLDAAVPILVLHICSAEDNEAFLEFLNVGEEVLYGCDFLCMFRVLRMRNSLILRDLCRGCI